MEDLSSFLNISKVLLDRETLKDVSQLEEEEGMKVLKYALISSLEKKKDFLSKKVSSLKFEGFDSFLPENKLLRLSGKIEGLKIHFNEEHFKKTISLVNEIEKGIENV